MTAIRSFNQFIRVVSEQLNHAKHVQIANNSEALTQLLLLALMSRTDNVGDSTWQPEQIVLVLPSDKELRKWDDFAKYSSNYPVLTMPHFSMWGKDKFSNRTYLRLQRLKALSSLTNVNSRHFVLTTPMGLSQLSMCKQEFIKGHLTLHVGDNRDQDDIVGFFEDLGYVCFPTVEEEGTFAVRGGIIDVWPVNQESPVRFEFVGDSIESIRIFSAENQRSITEFPVVSIAPSHEVIAPRQRRSEDIQKFFNLLIEQEIKASDRDGLIKAFQAGVKFTDFDLFAPIFRNGSHASLNYFSNQSLLVFPLSIDHTIKQYEGCYNEMKDAHSADLKSLRPTLNISEHFLKPEDFREALSSYKCIEFSNPFSVPSRQLFRFDTSLSRDDFPLGNVPSTELFEKWTSVFNEIINRQGGTVAVLAHEAGSLERIRSLLSSRPMQVRYDSSLLNQIGQQAALTNEVLLGKGDLCSPIWLEECNCLLIPEAAIFGVRQRKPKPPSAKLQGYLSSLAELKVSDLVVHVQHGIGRYEGMTSLIVNSVKSEFLIIAYHGNDKIYLPVDRLGQLQRYSGASDASSLPPLDKLGGGGWEKRKARVNDAIKEMAEQLLKVQAIRSTSKGYQYGIPDDTYTQFEAAFPYDETDDQLRAIQDVENDLISGKPMDRLICGDVGFGKTEIALRATMRTVLEGLQTLVVVPTTVLCHQHYRTFRARLEIHGVKVAHINRLTSAKRQAEILESLKNGTLDVLIGTHRLFSKDITPKRLGLLVIDEEQRFGVSHKEKLKQLRANAHVLTLSATPIPRTLHMAMLGLKDISILATPPQDRVSVRTYVSQFDDDIIINAINNEILRGGQVFFVHNRVEDIETVRLHLKKTIPSVDIRVAHGQMKEHHLESIFIDFIEQKFQVLLCTTIIESGVDIPNVNTMFVNRADRLGLAQLHQLRGRVGRSSVQAHAYFLTPPQIKLGQEAQERLAILASYQELGSGFEIARHDLELRGAGNLLGGEQSGHVTSVGLELYTNLLDQAIKQLQGVATEDAIDPEIKVSVSAFIPSTYIASEKLRLNFYKKLFVARDQDEIDQLYGEFEDRYGLFPSEVKILFKTAKLKVLLASLSCARLTQTSEFCELRFAGLNESQISHVVNTASRFPAVYRLTSDYRLLISIKQLTSPNLEQQLDFLDRLMSLLMNFVS